MRVCVFSLVVGVGALVATGGLSAQRAVGPPWDAASVRAANNRFAGVWKLVGEESRDAKGQVVSPGPYAADGGRFGYITYDPAGWVGVNISWPKPPQYAGRQLTVPQALEALRMYNSYWGSFSVNEARNIVTHQVLGAVSPAFAGTNQERGFTISGNRLTLRPPTSANGDQRSLTWERVPDLPTLTPMHRKLIGFWKLISLESRTAKGEVLSSNPGMTGFIVYTASGHVMVHMMQPYRRRNVGPSPTPEETLATYRSYTSYFGPVTVNESEQFVVHHLAASFNSAAVGTDYKRFVEFSGKRLILRPPATNNANGPVQMSITWERLSE